MSQGRACNSGTAGGQARAPDPAPAASCGWSARPDERARPHGARRIRVTVAVAVFTAFLWVFTDVREWAPSWLVRVLPRSQFIPSWLSLVAGTGTAVAGILILALSLGFGRVYCSVLCPLGLYQDLVWWVRCRLTGPTRLPFVPAKESLRAAVFWLCAGGTLAGGAILLAWLDPYSIFGRIATLWFRPLAAWISNAATAAFQALGIEGWYRVPVPWRWGWSTGIAGALLLLVTALAAARGRVYCNTICPVGTLLGWLARRARWQLQLAPSRCRKCARCLEVCKAQCVDLRRQALDFSRCVLCFNCLSICPEQAVRFARRTRPEAASEPVANAARRNFLMQLTGLLVWGPALLRGRRAAASAREVRPPAPPTALVQAAVRATPPGSVGVRDFLRHCTACGLCVTACPTRVLQPAGWEAGRAGLMRPRMDYPRAFCNYDCHRCGEVCPTGAIRPLPLEEKKLTKIGEAELTLDRCVVVSQGTDCAACSEHCPTQAVTTRPYRDHLRVPELHPELCIGCGACEYACPVRPVRAIVVHGWAEHGRAEKWKETPPPRLPGTDDFPF